MCLPALALAALLAADPAPGDPLYKELTEQGVAVGAAKVKVPAPLMKEGLDAAGQRAVLDKVMGERYAYDEFIRDSVVAPFALTTTPLKGGYRIDLCFVAHGKFDALKRENLFTRITKPDKKADGNRQGLPSSTIILDEKALKKRGIEVKPGDKVQEKYLATTFPLLEKVQLSGVAHSVQTLAPDSVLATIRLDPRFVKDPDYPDQWRPITVDENGKLHVGAPQPYTGFGGYAKVVPLREPAGALFVEVHLVFNEPPEWFKSNPGLLRSKLPLLMQDNVRKFRRELARESKAP